MQVGGQQAGLPIVAVEDLGGKQMARHAQGGARQHGEANVVVGVVDAGFSVEGLAVVERWAIHQV